MDSTSLMLSLIFGTIGMAFLVYGRKAGQFIPIGAGLALMICPYFIPSAGVLLVVCLGLTALPFLARSA